MGEQVMVMDETLLTRERPELTDSIQAEPECECMVCDLPLGSPHGPVEWRVTVHFPGPYPEPGDADMLLCEHCMNDWVHGEWPEPYDNFVVVRCTRV